MNRKKLRIAQIAPLWYKIPPEKYGGIELVIHNLTEELVKRGHDVTLFASGDSQTSARLFSVCPSNLRKNGVEWTDQKYTLLNLCEALKKQDEFDIIHSHVDLYDLFFSPFVKTPFISTMHNRIMIDLMNKKRKIDEHSLRRVEIYRSFPRHKIVSISDSQARLADAKVNFVGRVYNGIDLEEFDFNSRGSDHFIWIGRMHKQKGVENAISAAKKAKVKLVLAGRVQKDTREKIYFDEKIKPRLDGENIKFIGEISRKQKSEFFGGAKALLYPIEWDEPFGLVMAEAMACGTPVIAFDRGSARELVKDGKTGFVVKDIGGLKAAIKKIDSIDRRECRKHVENNFTIGKMADGYEEIYYKSLEKK